MTVQWPSPLPSQADLCTHDSKKEDNGVEQVAACCLCATELILRLSLLST